TANHRKSLCCKCPGQESNLHEVQPSLGPQPSASASSATWAGVTASIAGGDTIASREMFDHRWAFRDIPPDGRPSAVSPHRPREPTGKGVRRRVSWGQAPKLAGIAGPTVADEGGPPKAKRRQ